MSEQENMIREGWDGCYRDLIRICSWRATMIFLPASDSNVSSDLHHASLCFLCRTAFENKHFLTQPVCKSQDVQVLTHSSHDDS